MVAQFTVAGPYGCWGSMEVYQEVESMTKASMTKARGIINFQHTLIYFHHDPGPSAFKLATHSGDKAL